jgi:hypothetical protein
MHLLFGSRDLNGSPIIDKEAALRMGKGHKDGRNNITSLSLGPNDDSRP